MMVPVRRQGVERVRTGCVTCKARKVKCDETRPECIRCQASGRSCAGYRTPPTGSFSWNQLLRVRPSILPGSGLATSSDELRGLDFFRCIVAPALAESSNRRFWTSSILQLAAQEPFTRHAVLAISSLYEHFETDGSIASDKQSVAVRNYNEALRQVSKANNIDPDTVLLVSILFMCIEFLRGKSSAAIEHCRHGIHILNKHGGASELAVVFRHLSIFPFFFGATISDFPCLADLSPANHSFRNISEVEETLDSLMSRSVRLMRSLDPYRIAVGGDLVPSGLSLDQNTLRWDMENWFSRFYKLRETIEPDTRQGAIARLLEMRWHVCQIWVEIAPCRDETSSDAYFAQFARIIKLGQEELSFRKLAGTEKTGIFSFEMGVAPLLHFVVMKCRFLRLRLEALWLLKTLARPRESLWDAALMHSIGSRIIEREHGVEVTPQMLESWSGSIPSSHVLPSNAERIRDSFLEDKIREETDSSGKTIVWQSICFFTRHPGKSIIVMSRDWIRVRERVAT